MSECTASPPNLWLSVAVWQHVRLSANHRHVPLLETEKLRYF